MSPGPLPELLSSRADRPGGSRWRVEPGPLRRGEAWTDLTTSCMRVPFGGGEHGRLVRAHELMHARVSPLSPSPFTAFAGIHPRAVECAEEFRVNELLRRCGFDLRELRDGSERLTGRRLAELGDLEELALFAAAIAGTGALGDLCAGARRVAPPMAAMARGLARELREAVRRVASSGLASTEPTTEGLPLGFLVHTRRLASIIERALATPVGSPSHGARRPRPAPTGRFAELRLDDTVALDRRLPGASIPRRVPAAQGRRAVRPARLVTDPARRCFERRAARAGGVVVVDQSGSMALDEGDLERLVALAPGAFVLGYSHAPGSVGVPNAWVLADRGRVATRVRPGNVGNGVDGPALRHALARRRAGEPVVWVCDGQVTDSGDHADPDLAAECAQLVLRHGVAMVPTVAGALETLRRRGDPGRGPRLLGRVAAAVTAAP